jgi:UDP-N-acetylglucosamine 2-epimerase (non-hydrolysing)
MYTRAAEGSGERIRVLVVAGARPNFVKVAPILAALRSGGHEPVLVHTGQHYDDQMSAAFFRDLGMPEPDFHLGAGAGTHAQQTARIMEAFEPVLLQVRPAWVVVVGDVNSTLACSLVAAKLRHEIGCRIAHVEAGLRSGDWRMPEEVNRVLADRLSDLLFTPSRDALPNLLAEGIPAERVHFAGNVMIDTLLCQLPRARELRLPERFALAPRGYAAVTVHRPSNVDSAETLQLLLEALGRLAEVMPVVLPLHPRTRRNVTRFQLDRLLAPLRVFEPFGYLEMVALLDGAAVVLTDSGGVQEETTALGVPCVTLREQTERPVTVEQGTNRLAPWPLSVSGILQTSLDAVGVGRVPAGSRCPEGWDGQAARRIVARLTGATEQSGDTVGAVGHRDQTVS